VGFNAAVSGDVTVGAGSLPAAGTVVPDGYEVPPESFVAASPLG
jgi:carbonic anhydrase/acetyltransferase-like protein (isoleucine patch superfamily)